MASFREGSQYYYIAANDTYQVQKGRGVLKAIIFNKPVASSTVKLIDGDSGTTANMGIITNTTAVGPYELWYDLEFKVGLRIVTSDDDDITVVYS